jgi:O-antigen ligase
VQSAKGRPEGNIQHPTSKWGVWVGRVFLLAAAGVMGVGLVKSYSRGAWVGAAVGVALIAKAEGRRQKAEDGEEKAESGKQKVEIRSGPRALRWAVRRCCSLTIICCSVGVLGFWSFGHTERAVARRAYSVANANDFSWRKRMAAYEGALQMMTERPWFGFGWNQPAPVYSAFYCPAKVDEAMAIQLNDFLMLGMTLGLPALLCFAVYIALALTGRQKTGLPAPPTLDSRRAAAPSQRVGHWTLDSSAVCRAGAVVLLVGFWFDGGLFKLPTAATFWILLELGRAGDHEMHEAHENE